MNVHVLGPTEAFSDDGALLPVGGPKQRTVLATLALSPGEPVSTDRLINAVWGDEVPVRAARSLSTYVSNLRRVLGDVIVGASGTYTLTLARSDVDASAFEDLLDAADRSTDQRSAVALLRDALASWKGTPFEGVDQHGTFTAESIRLDELRVGAIERVIQAEIASGRHGGVIAELEALVERHPHREHLRALHMRALYGAGRQADALRSYRVFKEQLTADLGLDPSPELQDLELQILQQDPSLSPDRPAGEPAPLGLPERYSSFVGRADELDRVHDQLATHRLISLIGPGGIGKSSLAMEAARRWIATSGDSVARVVIEPLGEGEITSALATAMGLAPAPGVDPATVITGYIAQRPHLIVLDGCEPHLGETALLAHRLLTSTAGCRVLATSREALGLNGEHTIRVQGLPLEEAVMLFADRSDLPTPLTGGMQEAAEKVCAAVDGMALAIELAAARTRSIPIERVAQRIGEQMMLLRRRSAATERHISMESTIAWSSDLLDEGEQAAFRWLSLFGTGFSIRDAEGILGDPYAEDRVVRLVEVSLLQPVNDQAEYRYLEPVRQFAVDQLHHGSDEPDARLGHARWMASEAIRFSLDQWTPDRHEVMDWLFRRRFDLYDAANWAVANDAPDIAVCIVAGTGRRLTQSGVAGDLLPAALAAIDHRTVTESAQLAIAMAHVTWMLKTEDRLGEADELIRRAIAIAEATGDLSALGHVEERLAVLNSRHAVRDEDLQLMDKAIRSLEAADSPELSTAYHNRAVMLFWADRPDDARRSFAAANDRWLLLFGEPLASFLDHQASICIDEGDQDSAVSLLQQAAESWEANAAYPQAAGVWWVLADAAYVLARSDLMAVAVDRHRRLELLAGVERPLTLDIWNGAMQHRWADVFTAAARWLEVRTTRPLEDLGLISDDIELTMFGSTTAPPAIFFILHPVVTALHATGRTREACEITREVPGLIAQAPHRHWKLSWELEQWGELTAFCGDQPPIGLSLPEAFVRVKDLVLAAASGDQ